MSFSQSKVFFKISATFGILFPIIAITFISIATHLSEFNYRENWISDISGPSNSSPIYSSRGLPSILLNLGLIISGIFGTIFAIALKKSEMLKEEKTSLKNKTHGILDKISLRILNLFGIDSSQNNLANIGEKFLIVAMFSLFGCGIFPETILILHIIFGITLFLAIPFALIFIGIAIRNSEKKLGNFVLILGIVSLVSLFLLIRGKAIAEIVSVFSLFIFSVIFGVKLFKMQR